jgi:hypothetical protein
LRLDANFTLRPLYLQTRSPWYPLYKRLGGPRDGDDFKETLKIFREKKDALETICISVYRILLGAFLFSVYI